MSETKITDLVPEETIEKIKELNREIQNLLNTYTETAKDLAKGIDINVRVVGDLDKLEKLLVEKSREATATAERLNTVMAQQGQVIANTTNTISRQLMEQERVNKTQREAYTDTESFKRLLEEVNGSYENRIKRLTETNQAIAANKKQQEDLKKSLDVGRITQEKYNQQLIQLTMQERELKQVKADLNNHLKNEEREMNSVEGSYRNMSQRLELMKKAYKDLTEEERNSPLGKEMEAAIQNLNAHLIDLAADMGEFHRNVGNYAIAGRNGVVATESLIEVMNKQALTMQDLADQTKILEEGKRMLDTTDKHYSETLAEINARIDQNKAKLTDVSDILEKDAASAAEAEAQNKRLKEAMKHIDLSADDAQEKIDKLNAKIEKNNQVINSVLPTTERLAKEQEELAKAAEEAQKKLDAEGKANTTLAGQMLSLVGINESFASSLTNIESNGNVFEGLNTKAKALGKTLLGLLANPWMLTFLGITGVAAGFKWWYDYNKGLIEASRLTQNFTGLTGDAADKVTTDCQAMADKMGKGFSQTIGAANTLAQQFGLSWEDALQKIQDGIVAGADMNGNLLENIDRFSGAFHDAGIEADQFMAILAETRNGIFDEKALKSITDAGTRLRSMTKNTEESLDAIGISSKEMQKDLAEGNITMLEAIQKVTDKMKELPPNCQEVGDIMKNVFGRKSAMAGEEVIKSISGINDNLEIAKANMGELGRVNEEQLNAQKELQETLAAVFKMGGTSFEEMTTKAKTYIAQGLTAIIKKSVDIANWFIRIYNSSESLRTKIEEIGIVFKVAWSIIKNVCLSMAKQFEGLGGIIEGAFNLNPEQISKGIETVKKGYKDAVVSIGDDIVDAFKTAKERVKSNRLNEFTVKYNVDGKEEGKNALSGSTYKFVDKESPEEEKARLKAEKEAEKRAKEELKRIHDLEDSKIAIMADSHEKDLALIRQKFKKKIDEINGDGETEKALRLQLAEECRKEIEDCELKYQQELAKINLENQLASVKKGGEEELTLRLAQLEKKREEEVKAAEKTGADVNLINAKFNKERADLEADYASRRVDKIEEQYAVEEITRNKSYADAVNALKERYTKELSLAKGNADRQEELKRRLEDDLYKLEVENSLEAAEASIRMIEEILDLENMSAEDRMKWENELAKAKIDLSKQVADANAESVERQMAEDDRLRNKRLANLEKWMSFASDAIGNIGKLISTLYDGQVCKIEEQQEANTEAGESEQERISQLVEQNVLTEEEGEARKRAAAEKTARKDEELERKKQQLKHKQAVWDKANSIAQAGIATALAIAKALPDVVLAAIAAAMGAAQIATIIATPIPKYAKGTDYHKGGPAIVGDGGHHEVILYKGSSWLTPDKPTLVDLPVGATVIPDLLNFQKMVTETHDLSSVPPTSTNVVVNNDYSRLEGKLDNVIGQVKSLIRDRRTVSRNRLLSKLKDMKKI